MKVDATRGGWITYADWILDLRPMVFRPLAFRKDMALDAKPSSATLIVSAADRYGLWINGRLVGYGPARSYPARKTYDEYEIAPFLRKGVNRIAALVTPCTGANFVGNFTRMGLFAQGEARVGGKRVEWASDGSWHCRIADWIDYDYLLISVPVGQQEHADLTAEDGRWRTLPVDGRWQPALYLGPAGMTPWVEMEPRPVARPEEAVYAAPLVWRGKAPRVLRDVSQNLAMAFNRESVVGASVARETSRRAFEDGAENVWTFDFGRTRLVRPGIVVERATGPARIELFYDARLGERPTASPGFRGRMEGNSDSVTISGGRRMWEALVPRGMRFLTVRVAGRGRVRWRLAARTVEYPFADGARFESPDRFLARSWEVSKNNLRSSTSDAAVDCCNRENLVLDDRRLRLAKGRVLLVRRDTDVAPLPGPHRPGDRRRRPPERGRADRRAVEHVRPGDAAADFDPRILQGDGRRDAPGRRRRRASPLPLAVRAPRDGGRPLRRPVVGMALGGLGADRLPRVLAAGKRHPRHGGRRRARYGARPWRSPARTPCRLSLAPGAKGALAVLRREGQRLPLAHRAAHEARPRAAQAQQRHIRSREDDYAQTSTRTSLPRSPAPAPPPCAAPRSRTRPLSSPSRGGRETRSARALSTLSSRRSFGPGTSMPRWRRSARCTSHSSTSTRRPGAKAPERSPSTTPRTRGRPRLTRFSSRGSSASRPRRRGGARLRSVTRPAWTSSARTRSRRRAGL